MNNEEYWFRDKIILCGPFVGEFREEILSFKPFVDWLNAFFSFPKIIISTHYNRKFLYEHKNEIIPIFSQYTKDEISQNGHKHNKINSRDYVYLTNEIRERVSKRYSINKGDIVIYNLGYSSLIKLSYYQKIFFPFLSPSTSTKKDKILYIPYYSRPRREHMEVIDTLFKKGLEVEVIGDMKTKIKEYNDLLDEYNYNDIVYSYILKKMMESKIIITPCSHWTILSNLHHLPVFSWGKNVSSYKSMFRFGNDKCTIVPFSNSDASILKKSVNSFLEQLDLPL